MHGLEDVQLCTNARVEKMWNWWVIFSPQACALTSMQAQGTNYTRNQPEIRGVRCSLNTMENCSCLTLTTNVRCHCEAVQASSLLKGTHISRAWPNFRWTNMETSSPGADESIALPHLPAACVFYLTMDLLVYACLALSGARIIILPICVRHAPQLWTHFSQLSLTIKPQCIVLNLLGHLV